MVFCKSDTFTTEEYFKRSKLRRLELVRDQSIDEYISYILCRNSSQRIVCVCVVSIGVIYWKGNKRE